MPIADRPVSGASIESVWGQQVHDYTFSPAGFDVSGSAAVGVATTYTTLNMDTVTDDPGGYLDAANDRVEIPTGGEGLYLGVINFRTTTGTTGQAVLCTYALNGTPTAAVSIDCVTGEAPQATLVFIEPLVAGDLINSQGRKQAAGGATPTVQIMSFRLVRIGADYGAL